MKARLTQLIARMVSFVLFGISGWIAGGPVQGEQAEQLDNIGAAITIGVVGALVFLGDLIMHKLQTGWMFKNPEKKP
jgi:mannitol-specific phosphotransferase system IIBC component